MKRVWRIILSGCAMMLICLGLALQTGQQAYAAKAAESVPKTAITRCYVSAGQQGFHPSSKNYLPIQVQYKITDNGFGGMYRMRLRILNEEGRYVFQKLWNISGTGYLRYRWNGKASAKNQAGLASGSVIGDGTYQVQLTIRYQAKGAGTWKSGASAVRIFEVTRQAPSGSAGLAASEEIPVFTGNKYIDYIAEQMVQEAEITDDMTADEKVEKIYHYMTTHFHHVHYSKSESYKIYYSTTKRRSKINAYRKETTARYKAGELLYDYTGSRILWNMKRRIGVCTDHALVFQILCRHVGVDAGVCRGYYLNRDGSTPTHSWNYAVVDGIKYYYDVDVEIQNYGKGQGDYYWYKKTLTQAKETHLFT